MQILNDLRRAGLVESRRGKSGGYLLGKPADKITLRQVVEAVEPALLQHSTSQEGESGGSVSRGWQQVSIELQSALDKITMDNLAAKQSDPMFYI